MEHRQDTAPPRLGPDEDAARAIVCEAARGYFAARRQRIDAFVDRHFSLAGTAALHRHALGWDLAKAPANLFLAVPNVLAKAAAAGAERLGAARAAGYLRSRNLLFETAVGREIEWLIMTELLELPYRQGGRESRRDALAEAILADPRVAASLAPALEAVGRRADDPSFRRRLEESMAAYAGTRAAAAEIATGLLTLGTGALAVKQATPGMLTLGPALAATMAQQAAIASFPLGSTLGGLWYGAFPAAASPALIAGVTGGLLAVGTVAAAFAGLLTDPLQRRLGLHRRRLARLIDTLERQVCDGADARFTVRDHYVARLLDLFDLIGSAYRLAHA